MRSRGVELDLRMARLRKGDLRLVPRFHLPQLHDHGTRHVLVLILVAPAQVHFHERLAADRDVGGALVSHPDMPAPGDVLVLVDHLDDGIARIDGGGRHVELDEALLLFRPREIVELQFRQKRLGILPGHFHRLDLEVAPVGNPGIVDVRALVVHEVGQEISITAAARERILPVPVRHRDAVPAGGVDDVAVRGLPGGGAALRGKVVRLILRALRGLQAQRGLAAGGTDTRIRSHRGVENLLQRIRFRRRGDGQEIRAFRPELTAIDRIPDDFPIGRIPVGRIVAELPVTAHRILLGRAFITVGKRFRDLEHPGDLFARQLVVRDDVLLRRDEFVPAVLVLQFDGLGIGHGAVLDGELGGEALLGDRQGEDGEVQIVVLRQGFSPVAESDGNGLAGILLGNLAPHGADHLRIAEFGARDGETEITRQVRADGSIRQQAELGDGDRGTRLEDEIEGGDGRRERDGDAAAVDAAAIGISRHVGILHVREVFRVRDALRVEFGPEVLVREDLA